MDFKDIKTLTYVQNIVSVNGIDIKISTSLDNSINAVQYHNSRDFFIEEPKMEKVPISKYGFLINEINEVIIKNLKSTPPSKYHVFDEDLEAWVITKSNQKKSDMEEIRTELIEIIEIHVQKQIDIYNEENNTMFSSIHSCPTYKDISTYPHQKFCEKIVLFNAQVWETGRKLQVQIEKQEREVPTKEEFIKLLPIFDKE